MTLLIVFVGIIAFSNLVFLLGLAYLAITIKKLLDKNVASAVSEVQSTIKNVGALVDTVEDRTEQILAIGEDTMRKVSGSVAATADIVEHSVSSPLIGISSFLAGVSRAVETWRRASVRS